MFETSTYLMTAGGVFIAYHVMNRYLTFKYIRESMITATNQIDRFERLKHIWNARMFINRHAFPYMLRAIRAESLVRNYTMQFIDQDLRYQFLQELNNVLQRKGLGFDPANITNTFYRAS